MARKPTKKEAVRLLWEQGDLSYKLKGVQLEMRGSIYNSKTQTTVFLVSRQTGKTFTMCTVGTETCVSKPNQLVFLVFPKKKDAVNVAKSQMKTILADCPPHLKPEYMVADKTFVFPNGSELRMVGTDSGSAESIRGSTSHLILMDEAGFHDYNDFQYIVTGIIFPTLLTTKGKIVMASTPSKEPDHAFMTNYVEPFRADGRLVEYDIYSNPLIDEETIAAIAENFPLGVEDPDYQREYLLKTNVSNSLMVVPEFYAIEQDVVMAQEVPPYYDAYVSCDPAVIDIFGIIYGYYDFLRKKLVILDESALGGEGHKNLTTEEVADEVRRKERNNFFNKFTGEYYTPYMRIIDNNMPLLTNDLYTEHGLQFIATEKKDKEDKVNKTRMMLRRGEIEIHPRCKNLIDHIKTAKWDKARKKFVKNKGNIRKGIKGNHSDLLDALIYLVRNLQPNKDPFPLGYFDLQGDGVFQSRIGTNKNTEIQEFMHAITNKKP